MEFRSVNRSYFTSLNRFLLTLLASNQIKFKHSWFADWVSLSSSFFFVIDIAIRHFHKRKLAIMALMTTLYSQKFAISFQYESSKCEIKYYLVYECAVTYIAINRYTYTLQGADFNFEWHNQIGNILSFLYSWKFVQNSISCFSSYGNNCKLHPFVLEHSRLKGMISSIPGKIYVYT